MSSIKVNCVNEKLAKQQLKNAPKELQQYVNALEASNERWKFVNDEALKKIREQAKIISSNPVLAGSSPDFELKFCEKCFQMTNHLDGKCQK